MTSPSLVRWTAAVFAVAWLVHGAAALAYRADPFFTTYIADAMAYDAWALRLANEGLASEPSFHQAPLFPLLLGGLYALAGDSAAARLPALLLQTVLGSAAIALLVPLGRALFASVPAGVASAGCALAFGPLVFNDLKLLPTALALLTQGAGLLLLIRARARPNRALELAAGAAWGLACLARAEMVAFVPIALLALATARRPARVGAVALWLAGLALVVGPVTAHNLRRGESVLIASSAGENLWVGNQIGGGGGHTALDPRAGDIFSQRVAAERIAEQSAGRELSAAEVSRYWTGRTLDEIRAHPQAWLALELRKLGRLAHPGEPTDLYSFGLERERYLNVLYPLAVSCWTLLILAGAGAAWGRRTLSTSWPLLGLVGLHVVLLLVFFVDSRLRLPLLYLCAPLAGLAWIEGVERFKRERERVAVMLVAFAAVASVIVGQIFSQPTVRDHLRLAAVLSVQGRFEPALAILEPVLATPVPDPVVLDQAGWLEQQRGNLDEARRYYREALARGLPGGRRHQTHTRLAAVLERLGEPEAAAVEHDRAVGSPGANAGSYFERGMFRLRSGDTRGATSDLDEAIRLDPSWPAPRMALESLARG